MKHYPLGNTDDNRFVRIIRIVFGIACIAMAVYWGDFYFSADGPSAIWISIIFIMAFGLYQIWAGLGKASRYIEFDDVKITIRKNSLKKKERLDAGDLDKIDVLPLSIVFYTKPGKKTVLRLGTINYETNEKIVDEIVAYAERNNVNCEIRSDEI